MAYDSFLKFSGVDGECTDKAHEKWIEVFSFSHALRQMGSGSVSASGSRSAARCDHEDLTFVKRLDATSTRLCLSCCNGEHFEEVEIELCKATGDKQVYMKYKLEDVIITSYSVGGGKGGDEVPMETVSIAYGIINWEFIKLDPQTGKEVDKMPHKWNLIENTGA